MPFKSGKEWNGNKYGRPKKYTILDYVTEDDVKNMVKLAREQADAGKSDLMKFLLEQVFGKARQNIGLDGGEDGKNIVVEVAKEILNKNELKEEKSFSTAEYPVK